MYERHIYTDCMVPVQIVPFEDLSMRFQRPVWIQYTNQNEVTIQPVPEALYATYVILKTSPLLRIVP